MLNFFLLLRLLRQQCILLIYSHSAAHYGWLVERHHSTLHLVSWFHNYGRLSLLHVAYGWYLRMATSGKRSFLVVLLQIICGLVNHVEILVCTISVNTAMSYFSRAIHPRTIFILRCQLFVQYWVLLEDLFWIPILLKPLLFFLEFCA